MEVSTVATAFHPFAIVANIRREGADRFWDRIGPKLPLGNRPFIDVRVPC
jgi:hypothetical protein